MDGPYTDELSLKTPYFYPATIPNDYEPTIKEDSGGLAGFEMAAPHRYIRIVVKKTEGLGSTTSHPVFCWSEFRLYEGQGYDEENSLLTSLDPAAVQNLLDAVDKAKAALADGSANQATYDELQAAYDQFLVSYPRPDKVIALLDEANELYKDTTEGEGLGLYAAGSKEALKAAIDEVTPQVQNVMTLAQIDACVARMEAAISAFKAALQMPEEGKVFFIVSSSDDGTNNGHHLFAENNALNGIKHGGYVLDENGDLQFDSHFFYRLNYMWTLTKNEDGTFAIRNLGTGYYMSSGYTNNNQAVLQSEPPAAITLSAALNRPGTFNLELGKGLYANTQSSGALETAAGLVTWNDASDGNSTFHFSEVTWQPYCSYVDVAQGAQIITLPYEVYSRCEESPIYTVAGINAKNEIQFVEFTEEVIPAGTPFLLVNEDENVTGVNFVLSATIYEEIAYDFEAKTINGMVDTIQDRTLEETGFGILLNNEVAVTDESKYEIPANSGFFSKDLPLTKVVGDYSLPVVGGSLVGGNAVAINEEAYTRLTAELAELQTKLDAAKATVTADCKDVAAQFAGAEKGIQDRITAIADSVKTQYEAVALTKESTIPAADVTAEIDKLLADAAAAQKKFVNDAANARLTEELNAVQAKLDEAKKTVETDCKNVADQYTETIEGIQDRVTAIADSVKTQHEAINLTEESAINTADVTAAIEKLLTDAAAAQRAYEIAANDAAYKRLTKELAELQDLLYAVERQVDEECKDVAADFVEAELAIQDKLNALKAELKEQHKAVELTEESTISADEIKAEIEKILADAIKAQEAYGPVTGIDGLENLAAQNVKIFTASGKQVNAVVKGQVNILVYPDGTVKRVYVK